MKQSKIFKGMLLGLTVLLATSLFAASNNKGTLQTLSTVTVNGKTLPAGGYSLKWEGTGPNVQVDIIKSGKVVASTPARLVDLNASAKNDAAVVRSNSDGSKSLDQVRFEGKRYALQIGEESSAMETSGSTK